MLTHLKKIVGSMNIESEKRFESSKFWVQNIWVQKLVSKKFKTKKFQSKNSRSKTKFCPKKLGQKIKDSKYWSKNHYCYCCGCGCVCCFCCCWCWCCCCYFWSQIPNFRFGQNWVNNKPYIAVVVVFIVSVLGLLFIQKPCFIPWSKSGH